MKPGDVRLFEGGKVALVAAFGIWADKKGKYIRIDMTGDGQNFKHVVVTNNPESVMYHRTLFRDLRRLLIAYSKWPFGDEGAETEEQYRNTDPSSTLNLPKPQTLSSS